VYATSNGQAYNESKDLALKPIIKQIKMDIKKPSVGRIVHYFPSDSDKIASANNAEFVPAIVVQTFGGDLANLSVFPMNPDATNVLRYSVHHKSNALEGQNYWDWPQIN
jgi:hypothetical protein